MCNYPESYNASIAQKTYAIFEKFGDLPRMSYSQEYGSLFNLLQELHAISEEDQASILTQVYTNALQSAYDTFIAAQEAQTLEAADYQKGAIAENFEATSEAYAALVKRVNACILINGETDYKDFVAQMNVIIAHES